MKSKKKKLNGQLKIMKKVRKPMPPKTKIIRDKSKEKREKIYHVDMRFGDGDYPSHSVNRHSYPYEC